MQRTQPNLGPPSEPWHGLRDQAHVVEQFRACLARGRLASTFLFVGPSGVGKRTFAAKLAQVLLCERSAETRFDPCEHCPGCLQVAAGTHPDLELISRQPGRSSLLVEQFIGSLEKRGQEGLCHNLARKPLMGTRKVAIIDDADDLDSAAANCLLKTLEEPPPRSVLILIGTSPERQLPTIRSRCQIVRFAPLRTETVAELLREHGLAADGTEARRLARFSEGSLQRATELTDAELWSFRGRLLQGLARRPLASVPLAQELNAFVDEAGTEAAARRARARQVLSFAADFYGQWLRAACGAAVNDDEELQGYVRQASASSADPEALAAAAVRCLTAQEQIQRNIGVPNALDCWLDDLSRLV
jgi:DNA polymerase-3 subunit delta'